MFAFEIATTVIVLVVIMVSIEVVPYLAASKENDQISMYTQKQFAEGNATLTAGLTASVRFNYSSYDPAILVVGLTFQTWQKPGDLAVYCNGKLISTVSATPQAPQVDLNVVSLSGLDLVKPKPNIPYFQVPDAYTYGNEITFTTPVQNGYEGTFSYQIMIRGSR